ncbi:VOC family protein [Neobacillus vireti]|uniref:VOC family protein n=1 Tax=Neobacillus vireti TaxID=220686 RepID=UPI002FFD9A43
MTRYKKLGYVALNVTDVNKSAQFYRDIVGLELVELVPNKIAFFRCSHDHHNLVLYPSQHPGLKRVAFEVEDENQLDIAIDRITKAGVNWLEVDDAEVKSLHQSRTIRFTEPTSVVTFELYSDIEQFEVPFTSKPINSKPVNITQLGHAVLEVEDQDFDDLYKFLTETLNFKISDVSGDQIGWAWLRAFPNPLHHSFAINRGKERKLNHISFQIEAIDDLGISQKRLVENNVPIVFGPGRHAPSGSLFLYYLDPDGLTLEYSQGMEEFPEEDPRQPRILQPTLETLDMWGGTPDPRFGSIGKIG